MYCSKARTGFFLFPESFDSKYSSGSVKKIKSGIDKTEGYIEK